jgi:hypothetical protein
MELTSLMALYFAFDLAGVTPMFCWVFSKEANNVARHFSVDYMTL